MDADFEHENPFASPLAEDSADALLTAEEKTRHQHLARETSIKSISGLYYFVAFLMSLWSLVLLLNIGVIFRGGSDIPLILVLSHVIIASTALFWWIARGLRRLDPRVRRWAIGLSTLGLLAAPIGTIIHGYFLYLLIGKEAQYIFSPEYKAVIIATPYVKLKTSLAAWILLVLFIALLAIGMWVVTLGVA